MDEMALVDMADSACANKSKVDRTSLFFFFPLILGLKLQLVLVLKLLV